MKAYIFYNGDDIELPDETCNSNWGGYRNPDSAKMFAVCANSWCNAGWQVERLRLRALPFWDGRLAKSPYPYNHLIPFLVDDGRFDNGIFLVTTDVINYGFYEFNVNEKRYADIPAAHFTMSVGWFSSTFLWDAFTLLKRYDSGDLSSVTEHTDESVLRHYLPEMQQWCRSTDRLRHFSRSMLKRELNHYPTSIV